MMPGMSMQEACVFLFLFYFFNWVEILRDKNRYWNQ